MAKLFLYDPNSVTRDTLTVMRRKGYQLVALTADPDVFWNAIAALGEGDTLVILSHGDNDGPLAVAGNVGEDIDLARFVDLVKEKKLSLYLLSCHTGQNPCGTTLTEGGLQFVAPLGTAAFQTTGDETVNVYSKNGSTYPGWAGPLSPSRASKAVSLP